MKRVETIVLPAASPGTSRFLDVLCYGNEGDGPKVYIQAGLHADEAPGYVTAHHLTQLFDKAEIRGEIILVPMANPIGLSQWRDEMVHGRFHFVNSINFNRSHLDLVAAVAARVKDNLGKDADENVACIRAAFRDCIAEVEPADDAEYLKKCLLDMACDADIVLDLHCDHEALLHVYMGTPLWPDARDLSAQMGAHATLLAKESGGDPFDEACSRIWWELAATFPDVPIPAACLSATVELRGVADTDTAVCCRDAMNIFLFLQRRGVIAGEAPVLPDLPNEATPLTAVDYVKATAPGIVSYCKKPGDRVRKGDKIAEIINPLGGEDAAVVPVFTETDGLVFTRSYERFARPGKILAKVAGERPLRDDSGDLLTL